MSQTSLKTPLMTRCFEPEYRHGLPQFLKGPIMLVVVVVVVEIRVKSSSSWTCESSDITHLRPSPFPFTLGLEVIPSQSRFRSAPSEHLCSRERGREQEVKRKSITCVCMARIRVDGAS